MPKKKQEEGTAAYSGLVVLLVCILAAVSEPRYFTLKTAALVAAASAVSAACWYIVRFVTGRIAKVRKERLRARFGVIQGGLSSVPVPVKKNRPAARELRGMAGGLARR